MATEPSPIDRSIQAVSYELALEELVSAQPDAAKLPHIQAIVMDAILSLRNAGQKDPEMLARYAASKGVEAYRERTNGD